MKLSADHLDKVSPHKRMLFRDGEETPPAMVTHSSPYQPDHGALSFQTFLRQSGGESDLEDASAAAKLFLKSSVKSHMLSLDCRLPNHNFEQNSFQKGGL